jgi:predicted  nucleic acid-binding Zn-ribbon protein
MNPNAYKWLRKLEGGFRCDRCGWRWPVSHMVVMDGQNVCIKNCYRPFGREETEAANEEARQFVASLEDEYFELPVTPVFEGVPLVVDIDPRPKSISSVLAAPTTITLTGVNLNSGDSFSTNLKISGGSAVTLTAVYDSAGTSVVLTIPANTYDRGDYYLIYNNVRYEKVFKCR